MRYVGFHHDRDNLGRPGAASVGVVNQSGTMLTSVAGIVGIATVRRYLVQRLGLDVRADQPPQALVRRLEAVQVDPVNLLARNHELVFHCRLSGRRAGRADYYQGPDGLFEYIAGNRALLSLADFPLFVPFMRLREEAHRETLRRLTGPVRQVREEIERAGPLTSRQVVCAEKVSGYWDPAATPQTKATTLALQLLWESGLVTVVGRSGGESLYDLTERAVPADLLAQGQETPLAEARRLLREKYYRAMGVFDAGHVFFGWQHLTARERVAALAEDERRGAVERLPIEGVERAYWTVAGMGETLAACRGTAVPDGVRFLPPLDNLLWRRERLVDLFDFDYKWEIYTPAAKRKGGPYTMPILRGADLVGRLDAHLDRAASMLVIDGLRYEPGIRVTQALRGEVEDEIERLRGFCGVEGVVRDS